MSLPVVRSFETSYERRVRCTRLWTACLLTLALAGCYNPKVMSGGFACSSSDDPPCPAGYYCVDGLCLDDPNAVSHADMSAPVEFGTGGNGVTDLASTMADLSSGPDMARPAADMAKSTCGMTGDLCSSAADCCSGVCFLIACL
jgi:hypothetical protein